MKSDEMNAIRLWRFGSTKNISSKAKGFFYPYLIGSD